MSSALRRVPWRAIARLAGLALLAWLLLAASAWASSDLYSNVGPGAGALGGLADRYPLGNYALDQHFDAVSASLTGGVDVSGVPPMIAYFLANSLWQITAFLANALITVFTFAFSLDLVNGSQATGGAGALGPVSDAVRTIYSSAFGEPWLVVAVVLTGLWAIWRGLVQRRYTETAGSLGMSVVFIVIALAFVTQPERTIGQASEWSNRMSAAFLSLTSDGGAGGEQQAKRAASDQLFSLLVYQPWTVLQFGGTEHCARDGTGSDDSDPVSVPVRPLSSDSGRDSELRRQLQSGTQVQADGKTCINNQSKYAPHFLRYSSGSDDRNAEYDALNSGDSGKLPDSDPGKSAGDYQLGVADKPATDAMEKDGQYQRLLMAIVAFLAELGAFLLLGALSVAVILAQVLVLLLLAFAPVALVVGVFPGRGHDFFRGWLTRLVGFLLRKAVYSLILAVLLAVAAAVGSATSALGWLLSFSLQAAFFWTVFLWRHQLADTLLAATAGAGAGRHQGLGRLASTYYTARLATRPGRRLGRLTGGRGQPPAATERRPTPATSVAPAVSPASGDPQKVSDQRSEAEQDATRREGPGAIAVPPAAGSQATAERPGEPSHPPTPRSAPRRSEGKPSSAGETPPGVAAPPASRRASRAPVQAARAQRPLPPPPGPEPALRSGKRERPAEHRTGPVAPSAPPQRGGESPLAASLRADRGRVAGPKTAKPGKQAQPQPSQRPPVKPRQAPDARKSSPAGGRSRRPRREGR